MHRHLFTRDKDYVVDNDGEVIIVDEFTGRLLKGRRYNEGLHQAIEAKEGVEDQRRIYDSRHDLVPKLIPFIRKAFWYDRYCVN